MHQNMSTIQNLMNCRVKFEEQQILQNRVIVPFDFNKMKYEVGQWVDVKDTIDQWLEAQVLQVRNNQAFVHYNGWGTRWDEWIDFNSPRIAPFKTYTTQSPTTIFLSPYPSVACDANVEPQPRSIDSFYYLEKSVGSINDICKMIEYMSKLRKKNLSRFNEVRETIVKEEKEKSQIRKDDFVENRERENQFKQNTNTINFNNNLSPNDYELLFNASQLIPLLDRCGRMFCDMSLHLSHLVLNPSLYPQLLLGYNQNIEVSDTLSCTSGYSMYTNESSSITGLQGHQIEQNFLQNFNRNIQNSNQLITNYNMNHLNNNPNANYSNTTNTQQNHIGSYNQYNTTGSSPELPFIQRLQNSHSHIQSNPHSHADTFPKINLQVPSLLSPGETLLQSGINAFPEPNIDIYVHTLVGPNQPSNTNSTSNVLNNTSHNTNLNPNRNQTDRGTVNINNQNINNNLANINPGGVQNYSLNSLINQNLLANRSQSHINSHTTSSTLPNNTNNTHESEIQNRLNNTTSNQTSGANITNQTTNTQSNQSDIINNLLGNLMNMLGSTGNRRGSTTSESSNTSFNYPNSSGNVNTLSNTNHIINGTSTNTNTNSNNIITANTNISNRIVNSSQSLNNLTSRVIGNQSNSANNSTYKETSSQTDMTLNLLSLNKDNK
jgi:hypothetical protein